MQSVILLGIGRVELSGIPAPPKRHEPCVLLAISPARKSNAPLGLGGHRLLILYGAAAESALIRRKGSTLPAVGSKIPLPTAWPSSTS